MIGIIGAMDIETDGLKDLIENKDVKSIAGIEFVTGTMHGKKVVCAKCNPGKVNAALCAQIMINEYAPEAIVNSGVAGSLTDKLDVYSVAIAKSCVQHDYDTSALGSSLGMIEGLGIINFMCDEKIVDTLQKVCHDENYLTGVIATGDAFISKEEIKADIKREFDAIACEMEGGAVGHVCYLNNVKYGVLRVISDSGNNVDYSTFKNETAKKSIKIISEFIREY